MAIPNASKCPRLTAGGKARGTTTPPRREFRLMRTSSVGGSVDGCRAAYPSLTPGLRQFVSPQIVRQRHGLVRACLLEELRDVVGKMNFNRFVDRLRCVKSNARRRDNAFDVDTSV